MSVRLLERVDSRRKRPEEYYWSGGTVDSNNRLTADETLDSKNQPPGAIWRGMKKYHGPCVATTPAFRRSLDHQSRQQDRYPEWFISRRFCCSPLAVNKAIEAIGYEGSCGCGRSSFLAIGPPLRYRDWHS